MGRSQQAGGTGLGAEGQVTDPQRALAFAEAIAEPGGWVLLIDSDGNGAGSRSLSQAVTSGHAFVVTPRQGVVAVDLDDMNRVRLADEVEPKLRDERCYTTRVLSGRVDDDGFQHLHLWVVGPVWLLSEDLAQILKQNGFPAEAVHAGRAMRPPLAPHRNGVSRAVFLIPSDEAKALRKFQHRPCFVPFPDEMERLLRDLDPAVFETCLRMGVQSRDVAILRIVTQWILADRSLADLTKALLDPANQAGEKIRTKYATNPIARIEFLYHRQRRFLRESPPLSSDPGYEKRQALAARLDRARVLAGHLVYPSGTADIDHAVLCALLRTGRACLSDQPAVSHRKLAELCNLEHHASMRAVSRLEGRGLITVVPSTGRRQAASYRLHLDVIESGCPTPNRFMSLRGADVKHIGVRDPAFRDVFTNGSGLGLSAYNTWNALTACPKTTLDVCTRRVPNVSKSAVLSQLKTLTQRGLAARCGNSWTRLSLKPDELEALARRLGTHGSTRRRLDRMQAEQVAADTYHPSPPLREPSPEPDEESGAPHVEPETAQISGRLPSERDCHSTAKTREMSHV
jgi:hypothetical protein